MTLIPPFCVWRRRAVKRAGYSGLAELTQSSAARPAGGVVPLVRPGERG